MVRHAIKKGEMYYFYPLREKEKTDIFCRENGNVTPPYS